jgi:hypothetical protein
MNNTEAPSTLNQYANWKGILPVLWLLPIIFMIHDAEELFTMPGWLASHEQEINRFAGLSETTAEIARSLPVTFGQAAAAIGFFLVIFIAVTIGASFSKGSGFWFYAYACLLGVLFLHVFTHLAQAIFVGGYVPGLVGAIVAIIPGAYYIYKQLFERKLLTVKLAVITAFIGLALFIPGATLAHQIGKMLG